LSAGVRLAGSPEAQPSLGLIRPELAYFISSAAMTEAFHIRYSGAATGCAYQSWREEFSARWIAADFFPIGTDRCGWTIGSGSQYQRTGRCNGC